MSQIALIIAVVSYIAFLCGILYICVLADPDASPVARYMTEKLPEKAYNLLSRCLGKKALTVVEFFTERLLLLVYVVVVFGAWSIIFFYVYPWVDRQSYVSSYHKILGYAVFAACVMSWRYAATTSPGVITAKSLHRYDHFPYDNLLFVPNRTCKTRKIPKLARSKFDRYKYHQNVPRFDHFCGWVYNTIGEENYRFFLLFLFVHVVMCVYGTIMVSLLFYGEILEKKLLQATFVDRFTGEELRATKFIIFQYMFNVFLWETSVLILMGVMSVALSAFLVYHIRLTSKGMTTNESYKWSYINTWYKQKLKEYKDAVKNGDVIPEERQNQQQKTTTKPTVGDDGDVNCTPGAGGATDEVVEDEPGAIRDPGPRPRNLYDRGLVENWREVIYPISLREDRSLVGLSGSEKSKAS